MRDISGLLVPAIIIFFFVRDREQKINDHADFVTNPRTEITIDTIASNALRPINCSCIVVTFTLIL